jgi:clan AA aspartic protease (TIGR02281 family)
MAVKGNLPFVNVEVGGKKCSFLVDTGASDCVITPETAHRMGLYVSRQKAMVKTAAGDRVPIPMTLLPSLRIGKAEFNNVPAFVYDFGKIRGNITEMEGVVGFSIFRDATLTMDYPRGEMKISPGPTLDRGDPACIPMQSHTGVPRIPVHGGPRTVFVDVDSGSTGGLEINPRQLGVKTDAPPRPGGLSTSIGKTYRTGMARVVGGLHIGAVELADPIVEVTTGDFRVGGEVLQNTVISMDQPSQLARVALAKSGSKESKKRKLYSPSRIGTGIGFNDFWVVQDIVPGSPGQKAGVRVGDVCTAVHGIPTAELGDAYHILLRHSPILTYRFQRGSKAFEATVPVVLQVR